MRFVSILLTAGVALIHFYFLILEMFLWTKPLGLRVFRQSLDKARDSAPLAMNQGLYNGFLSAGLVWGLLYPDAAVSRQIQLFFLICVFIAGALGAMTVSRRIFLVQSLPAILAGVALLF